MRILGLPIRESQTVSTLREQRRAAVENAIYYEDLYKDLKERITELELDLEDVGWQKLSGESSKEFSRQGLQKINRLARYYWLKSPLIKRAVYTQTSYVFGKGVEIYAENEDIDVVIQEFINDRDNRVELTEHQSRMQKETELQLFGNLFFILFVNKATGQVKIRTIPVDEISDIITDPEDAKKPLYYKHTRTIKKINFKTGEYDSEEKVTYYADWNNPDPVKKIGGKDVPEDTFIYHIAVNKLSDQKFGTSEVYAAIDWSRAYKEFLEDWATLARAYSTFAWKIKTSGKKGIATMKDNLNTTYGDGTGVQNPPPVKGSAWISGDKGDLTPINIRGANMSADDGDKMIHMVSAATGVFYHYLTGDPSTGNLATAKAMEMPMLIMFTDRQRLWMKIYHEICWFVVKQSVKAPKGHLQAMGKIVKDETDKFENIEFNQNKEGEEIDASIKVKFPDILDKDIATRIDAIVKGATLGGGMNQAVALQLKDVTRYILQTLSEENIEDKIKEMYPDDEPETPEGYRKAFNALNANIKNLLETIKENGREYTK